MNLRFSEDSSILCFVARADGVWGSAALACVWAAAVFGQPRRWRLGSAVLGQRRRVDGVWAQRLCFAARRYGVWGSAALVLASGAAQRFWAAFVLASMLRAASPRDYVITQISSRSSFGFWLAARALRHVNTPQPSSKA